MKPTILVTGGAGYIGNVVCRALLQEGMAIKVIDKLTFGGEAIIDLLQHPRFEFIKGDITNLIDVNKALTNVNAVVHLAAIVGDPACAKQHEIARETNLRGTKLLYSLANKTAVNKFVFASTCSNYGKMKDPLSFVDEDSELSPVSLYAELKVESELYLLGQPRENCCKPTCLRFATAYGLSARPRFDLTINEFTKELTLGRELLVFGEQFWRPYCHVVDIARAIVAVLNADSSNTDFNVFNVGDTQENYQKLGIIEEIRKVIPNCKVKYVYKNEDPRDYKVSFKKIHEQLRFKITQTVPKGIREIHHAVQQRIISDPDSNRYKNS